MKRFNFNKIAKKLIDFYPFIIYSLIIVFAARKFLFGENNILYGEFHGSTNYLFFLKDFLSAWSTYSTFGQSNIGLTTSYGLNPVFTPLPPAFYIPSLFFFSLIQLFLGSFTMKFYILLVLFLPFLGMYYLARYWFKKLTSTLYILNSLSFISGLIYSINALMGDRISAGHLMYNLGYGLFPLLFLFTFTAIDENNNKVWKLLTIVSGLIMGMLFWLMPHLISLYLIVIGLYFLICIIGSKKRLIRFLIVVIFTGLIGFFLNINAWLPYLFFREELAYIADPTYISGYLYNLSRNIKLANIITLSSGLEQQFIKEEIYENLLHLKFLLPIIAIFGGLFSQQKRKSLFLILVGLTGIILSLGINQPFEKIYNFLYENIILFKPFRESGKFAILYLLSMSLLVPYVFLRFSHILSKVFIFIVLLLFTFLILYINPNFTSGNFGNTIIPFKIPGKYDQLNKFLSNQHENFKVTLYPNNKVMAEYSWIPKTINGSPFPNIFSLLYPLSKNLVNSNRTITDWASRYLDFIELNLDQPWAATRLGDNFVKYIIVDQSLPNYQFPILQLDKNNQLKKINAVGGFSIYEIIGYENRLSQLKKAIYYYGDIKGIKNIPASLALINLRLNSVNILSKNYSDTLVLYNSSLDDVFYTSLSKYNFSFFPEVRFTHDVTKGFYIPGEYLRDLSLKGITFYNPEIIGTNGKNNIKKISNLKKGKYRILLSTLNYENYFTNAIKVEIDNASLIRKNFSKKNNTFEWVDFGEVEIKIDNPKVAVENLENNALYLDSLLIVPVDQFKKMQNEFYAMIKSKQIISLKESDTLSLNTLRSNQKTIDVYSQNFSPYWKICDNPIFRVNFYGTGVACNKSSKLNPYFEPEMLYRISLLSALIFHLVLILLIIKLSNKNDQTN